VRQDARAGLAHPAVAVSPTQRWTECPLEHATTRPVSREDRALLRSNPSARAGTAATPQIPPLHPLTEPNNQTQPDLAGNVKCIPGWNRGSWLTAVVPTPLAGTRSGKGGQGKGPGCFSETFGACRRGTENISVQYCLGGKQEFRIQSSQIDCLCQPWRWQCGRLAETSLESGCGMPIWPRIIHCRCPVTGHWSGRRRWWGPAYSA